MIAIRADANAEIGMGHLMRCLSIAGELERRGAETVFFVSDREAAGVLAEKGRRSVYLGGRHDEKERELPVLCRLLGEYGVECVLLDSYEATPAYMQALRGRALLAYLDDWNAFCYPADIVINYTTGITKAAYTEKFPAYEGWGCAGESEQKESSPEESGRRGNGQRESDWKDSVPKENSWGESGKNENRECCYKAPCAPGQFLLGSRYVPLRAEFAAERIPIRENPRALLIASGGADGCEMLYGVSECLTGEPFCGLQKHLIAGRFCGGLRALEELAERDGSVVLHRDVRNIAELMRECDLAVTAGGTTLAELCACGIPSVCCATADNQLAGLRAYQEAGLALYAGDLRKNRQETLRNTVRLISALAGDTVLRGRIGAAAKTAIDGRGAGRIAKALLGVIGCSGVPEKR